MLPHPQLEHLQKRFSGAQGGLGKGLGGSTTCTGLHPARVEHLASLAQARGLVHAGPIDLKLTQLIWSVNQKTWAEQASQGGLEHEIKT